MKTFKDILKYRFKTYDESDIEIDKMNLDAATASTLHIEQLKAIFKNKLKDFNAILNLNNEQLTQTFSYYDALNWVNELYPKINAVINIGNDIVNAVNIHNKLFPNERIEGLTEDELYVLRDLKCI